MSFFSKKKICVTHNGSFHADDLFATATISILNKGNIKIVRTRDAEMFSKGDYVYDVGGIYDPENNRFDHHQRGGAGNRDNGIPYSAFGLVWKKYGEELTGNKEVAEYIERKIVEPLDAIDNGFDIYTPKIEEITPYTASSIFLAHYPTWEEDNFNIDKIFEKEVKKIVVLLKREIKVAKASIEGQKIVLEAYKNSSSKEIIVLEKPLPRYLIQDVLPKFPEPIYFIYPTKHSDSWKVEAVRKNLSTHESRKLFPEAWRGLMNGDQKLRELSGVDDIIFCHPSGFFAHTLSKDGAIKVAQKALIS